MRPDLNVPVSRLGTCSNKWDYASARFGTRNIKYSFTVADMDFACPTCVIEGLQKRLEHPIFGYSTAGDDFYEAVCGWFKRRHDLILDRAWLHPSVGIVTSLAMAIRALTVRGDKVMTFTPVYDPFFYVITSAERELVECELICDEGRYSLDYERIEKEFQAGVKAILFCNPHNPVGHVWSQEELAKLVELCRTYGVYLLSDEAHCDFALFGHKYISAVTFSDYADHIVACVAANKTFNMPGISTAVLIVPDAENKEKIVAELTGVWLKTPTVLGIAAATAGYSGADQWQDDIKAYLEENSEYVRSCISEKMPLIKPAEHQGTYLIWLDCSCFQMSMKELSFLIADRYGVALPSGSGYRGDGDHHLRINIACARSVLKEGLEGLYACYRDHVEK